MFVEEADVSSLGVVALVVVVVVVVVELIFVVVVVVLVIMGVGEVVTTVDVVRIDELVGIGLVTLGVGVGNKVSNCLFTRLALLTTKNVTTSTSFIVYY